MGTITRPNRSRMSSSRNIPGFRGDRGESSPRSPRAGTAGGGAKKAGVKEEVQTEAAADSIEVCGIPK